MKEPYWNLLNQEQLLPFLGNGNWIQKWFSLTFSFSCGGVYCTKEVRNGNCGRLMTALVQSRAFQTCNHSHLVVGHTHEDVDAVLSLVKRALDSERVLLTPRDFMRAIDRKLQPLFAEQNMVFKTVWVESVTFYELSIFLFSCASSTWFHYFCFTFFVGSC